MKVAFCSTDGVNVNEHFGKALTMAVYDVTPGKSSFVEIRDTNVTDTGDSHTSSIESKIKSIADCKIVYLNEIGGPAAAIVIKSNIHPVKVNENTPIKDILKSMEISLKTPPPWLKKILIKEGSFNVC